MALDNYADLQTSIASWLARPGDSNITSIAPDLITLFEAEATRRLKSRFAELTTTLSTVAGTATVALPVPFGEPRELRITDSDADRTTPLDFVSPEELDTEYPDPADTDQPVKFTIEGTNLRLGPVPDAVYTLSLLYQEGVPALSNSNTTNWLLTNHPDAYLYGSLAAAEAFIQNDERIQLWIAAREAAFESILLADRKARWGGAALQIRTDTGNP